MHLQSSTPAHGAKGHPVQPHSFEKQTLLVARSAERPIRQANPPCGSLRRINLYAVLERLNDGIQLSLLITQTVRNQSKDRQFSNQSVASCQAQTQALCTDQPVRPETDHPWTAVRAVV